MGKVAQLVGQIVGNYKLLDVLGEGGMGAVYKAEHILIGKKVALKMLHAEFSERPEIVQRFFTEAKSVNKIGHRNIVDISDYGQSEDGRPYFIMEHLEGIELAKELEKNGAMTVARALGIFRQAANGLEASHKHGIVHRDLKPENIFLLENDFVKILDFGIAKLQETEKGQSRTKTGLIMGTPAYMAPEQAEGMNVDNRSDIYSLGIILYEMLTGEQPFAADTFSRVLIKVLTEPVPAPSIKNPNIPAAIEAVLLKMVEKDQNARFQNVGEILTALTAAEANIMPAGLKAHVPAKPAAPRAPNPTTLSGLAAEVAPTPKASSRMGLMVGGAAVVFASAGAVVFFMLGPGQSWLSSKETPKPTPAVITAAASTPVAEPKSEPVTPPSTAMVRIELTSKPDGAMVLLDGKEVGQTPMKFELRSSDTAVTYVIAKEGYEPQSVEIIPNSNFKNGVVLDKAKKGTKLVTKPDTGTPDTGNPDTGKPDTGKTDLGDIDTITPPSFKNTPPPPKPKSK